MPKNDETPIDPWDVPQNPWEIVLDRDDLD